VLEEAQMISQGRHQIVSEIDNQLLLHGATRELDSLFRNLVVNAINYTPAGGAVRVRWYLEGDRPCFEVHDTGVGIAQHHIPRLTERFYRIDVARSRETGGSGLGLAIVKHVLQRHNGELQIDSEVGRGSTFRCLFAAELAGKRASEA
jgi:two-component system phosphate regulon sensor histidine kinase PhoR